MREVVQMRKRRRFSRESALRPKLIFSILSNREREQNTDPSAIFSHSRRGPHRTKRGTDELDL